MIIRALTVLLTGFVLLLVGFIALDIELTKRIVSIFLVLPIGGMLIASGLWTLVSRFVRDE